MMHTLSKEQQQPFTYGDYYQWDEFQRWELINGVPFDMTPTPPLRHQKISGQLIWQLAIFFQGTACEVYAAPFDVRLPDGDEPDEKVKNVVQPDVSVICDQGKLDDKGCRGAPDLVIEILSPYTARKDLKEKYSLYEHYGVKEYWIIHPAENVLIQYRLDGKVYVRVDVFSPGDAFSTGLFPGLTLSLEQIFQE